MHRTVVLNVVGLTPDLLGGPHTPNLNTLLSGCATIQSMMPAVTCPVQATYLTGTLPSEHGIVGNGWYFRDLGEVLFWRQSNRLVQGKKIWQEARCRDPHFTVANTFWWYNMVTDVDYAITPRPLYLSDGRKLPDCYSIPAELRDFFNDDFGQFPLFHFWGPATSIVSSEWIARAAKGIDERYDPTLQLVYLPHLDYCLQRVGPKGEIARDLSQIDAVCGELLDYFCGKGCRIVVLSEYGIEEATRPVHPNRILRDAGFLSLKVDLGREYLDPGTSRAFAVVDHQVAHIYVRDRKDLPEVRELLAATPGVERVLDESGKRDCGMHHERSGELLIVADRGSWFTYYWWHDDARAPDYARTVNIHAKPGYDPCELFIDPAIRFPRLKIGWTLAKKVCGFRYLMDVIPLDASLVKGSHGRIPATPGAGPLFMTSEPRFLESGAVKATDVYHLLLRHLTEE
ncbi:alkaline phosphatase family protein [Geomonas sp. RF6]|uniref:alkaline phosphatase family protein n=1 Tax=Geomonas sp. RF6 TaxID=2897342 RepID=UPI001E4E5FA6|nr:nucleotide pyrophosphatase/phosphodiesterase family protein [Geomonas sp. RF6]UFS69563.1 alkaline phosphatase family protein [Geomonas sp. RF6]